MGDVKRHHGCIRVYIPYETHINDTKQDRTTAHLHVHVYGYKIVRVEYHATRVIQTNQLQPKTEFTRCTEGGSVKRRERGCPTCRMLKLR